MRARKSCHLLQVGIDLIVDLNHDLLPIGLAPISLLIHVSHDLSLFVCRINLLYIHTVHLHQVLLEFRFAEEVADSEVYPLFTVVFGSAHELHLVIDEFDLGLWLAEVACDRWLESLWVHVVLIF